MQRYEITGMSCAACASHVEKAVAAVPGVASVAVSLLTNSMQVDYAPDADPDATARRILRAVDAAGYGASLASAESESAELEDTETPKLKKRLIASLCFLVPLMYVSMGHMIGLPLGSVFHGGGWHAILYAGTQLALTLPVCWINRAFFISGWKGVKTRAPGMDTLVALGAGASLAYGLFAIVMICLGLSSGNDDLVMQYRHDLYFESAAMILTLITVGKTLEAYSKGKTTDALKSLMKLAPQTACVLRGGEQVTVPVSEVNVGETDFVLLLAKEDEIEDGMLDTAKVKAFRVPAGTAVEVYGTTLHYAPCQTTEAGFRVAVVLPKGTNTEKPVFEAKSEEDTWLTARNKWLLAHPDSSEAKTGAHIGLTGKNIDILDA